MEDKFLEIINVTKRYGNFTAVEDLSLHIYPGDIFAFLGPNGAGKTTTIKMITGLLIPTSGKIKVCGIDNQENHIEAKRLFGYIPDQAFLYDKLTGKEFLMFSGGLFGLSKDQLIKGINNITEKLNLGDWLNKRTEEYSQGMKQRIAIASALLHDPKILIVDEPIVGLDPYSTFLIKKLFQEYASAGKAVFMSTHSLHIAEEICNKVGIIKLSKLIFINSMSELHKLKEERKQQLEELFIEITN